MSTKNAKRATDAYEPPFRRTEQEKKDDIEKLLRSETGPKLIAFLKSFIADMPAMQRMDRDIITMAGGESKALEYLIGRFLEDYHKGLIEMPDIQATAENVVPGARLVFDFIEAVARGDRTYLRRIADAVPRVRERAEGRGENFTLKPADEKRAKVFAYCDQHGTPKNAGEMAEIMSRFGVEFDKDNLRVPRRWLEEYRGEAGKKGRPAGVKSKRMSDLWKTKRR